MQPLDILGENKTKALDLFFPVSASSFVGVAAGSASFSIFLQTRRIRRSSGCPTLASASRGWLICGPGGFETLAVSQEEFEHLAAMEVGNCYRRSGGNTRGSHPTLFFLEVLHRWGKTGSFSCLEAPRQMFSPLPSQTDLRRSNLVHPRPDF